MTGFSADWLALREPADQRARNRDLLLALVAWRQHRETLPVVDLGAGTGATLRALAAELGGRQVWLLLDQDRQLLDQVAPLTRTWAGENGWAFTRSADRLGVTGPGLELTVRLQCFDLTDRLTPIGFASDGLVTASALLDLVSERWLSELAIHCANARAAFYAALSYDGRLSFSPALQHDRVVQDLINRHQTRDKGFGGALGPGACAVAHQAFAGRGYRVRRAPSDWRLDGSEPALRRALLHGWAEAAGDQQPERRRETGAWLAQRLDLARGPESRIRVGHQDLLALPLRSQSNSTS